MRKTEERREESQGLWRGKGNRKTRREVTGEGRIGLKRREKTGVMREGIKEERRVKRRRKKREVNRDHRIK